MWNLNQHSDFEKFERSHRNSFFCDRAIYLEVPIKLVSDGNSTKNRVWHHPQTTTFIGVEKSDRAHTLAHTLSHTPPYTPPHSTGEGFFHLHLSYPYCASQIRASDNNSPPPTAPPLTVIHLSHSLSLSLGNTSIMHKQDLPFILSL